MAVYTVIYPDGRRLTFTRDGETYLVSQPGFLRGQVARVESNGDLLRAAYDRLEEVRLAWVKAGGA